MPGDRVRFVAVMLTVGVGAMAIALQGCGPHLLSRPQLDPPLRASEDGVVVTVTRLWTGDRWTHVFAGVEVRNRSDAAIRFDARDVALIAPELGLRFYTARFEPRVSDDDDDDGDIETVDVLPPGRPAVVPSGEARAFTILFPTERGGAEDIERAILSYRGALSEALGPD